MITEQHNRENYWQEYYAKRNDSTVKEIPSQFATFVAQEVPNDFVIFDVGFGSARDSLFFNEYGFNVIGFDGCPSAVDFSKSKAKLFGCRGIEFYESLIDGDEIYQAIDEHKNVNICVYARFFLHAINDQEQTYFFNKLATHLKPGDMLAFEYRNNDDEAVEKIALPHYRRYQSSADVNAQLKDVGFEPLYSINGKGFAKYKTEDAEVSRSIFKKR